MYPRDISNSFVLNNLCMVLSIKTPNPTAIVKYWGDSWCVQFGISIKSNIFQHFTFCIDGTRNPTIRFPQYLGTLVKIQKLIKYNPQVFIVWYNVHQRMSSSVKAIKFILSAYSKMLQTLLYSLIPSYIFTISFTKSLTNNANKVGDNGSPWRIPQLISNQQYLILLQMIAQKGSRGIT